MDLRTQKIYDALLAAFKELLAEKPFEQITVNELCERARTRRATFYKHFADKYEFMDYMMRQMRSELVQNAAGKFQSTEPKDYYHALVDLGLDFVQENKKMLLSMNNSSMVYVMLQTVTDTTHLELLGSDEVQIQFLMGALNQCAKWWVQRMDTIPKEEMQERLYRMVDRFYDD